MEQKVEIYPISIEPMAEGGYFAECSLLQGCHAEGETFTEAINNLQDVIRVHRECREERGEIIPAITIKKRQDFRVTVPLPVPLEKYVS